MANWYSSIRLRWRDEIKRRDPSYSCIKHHKKNIGSARRSGRLVVFWSFVSVFYIYGDISIGIQDPQKNLNEEVIVWGIPFLGVTEKTFLSFLCILVLYYSINLLFVIMRVHIISNSILALKEIVCLSKYSTGWVEHDVGYENPEPPVGISFSVTSGGGHKVSEKRDDEYAEKREMWLFMMKYRTMGFFEYFLAPIIFPIAISSWALSALLAKVSS